MNTNKHESVDMKKLLNGVTVEWKALGEVGEFIRGNGLQKKDFVEEGFPAIHYGQIYTVMVFRRTKRSPTFPLNLRAN